MTHNILSWSLFSCLCCPIIYTITKRLGGVTSFPCGDPRVGGDRIADGRVRASFVRSFVPRASFSTAHPPPPTPSTHPRALPWPYHCTCVCCQRCMVSMLAICPNSLFLVSSTASTHPPIATHSAPLARLKQQKLGSQLSPALWAAKIQTIFGQS